MVFIFGVLIILVLIILRIFGVLVLVILRVFVILILVILRVLIVLVLILLRLLFAAEKTRKACERILREKAAFFLSAFRNILLIVSEFIEFVICQDIIILIVGVFVVIFKIIIPPLPHVV